jgi:hypothetical protein
MPNPASITLSNGAVVRPGDRVPMTSGSLWYVVKLYEGTIVAGPPGNSDVWQFNTDGKFVTTLHNHPWPSIDLDALAAQRVALATPGAQAVPMTTLAATWRQNAVLCRVGGKPDRARIWDECAAALEALAKGGDGGK